MREYELGYLLQAQPRYPYGTQWEINYDPITALGDAGWVDYSISVNITIAAPAPIVALKDSAIIHPHHSTYMLEGQSDDPISAGAYGGVCLRQQAQWDTGFCFLVGAGLVGGPSLGWVMQQGTSKFARTSGTILASGPVDSSFNLSKWHSVSLQANGRSLTAAIDGHVVASDVMTNGAFLSGLACLRSGYHFARFDNLVINARLPPSNTLFFSTLPLGCSRNDFTGPIGAQIVAGAQGLRVLGLGRFGAASSPHLLALIDPDSGAKVTHVTLLPGNDTDAYGFRYAFLPVPAIVPPNSKMYLVSYEEKGDDQFCDAGSSGSYASGVLQSFNSLYFDQGNWYVGHVGNMYGPVNALISI